jgi:thiol-disulfide isomerase/thioredoxin
MHRWNRSVILTALLLTAGQAVAQQTEILRESLGARATELSAMELKPFDQTLWTSLSAWTNGSALDASATDGRVVLIATWASWNPAATRAISTMQNLKKKFGDDGLIVVGVHHAQGWDKAAQALSRRKADFLYAHDADGLFRAAIKSDQDPDFYVIDRAGQLRFADIRTESVQSAVKQLLTEDAAAAGSLVSRMEAEAAKRDAEFRKPTQIQGRVDLRSKPEVPFIAPSEFAYQVANWPERKIDDDNQRDNDSGPRAVAVPGSGWFGDVTPKTEGRAIVYYAWKLDDPRGVEIVRDMNKLQRKVGRDAVVVGVLTGINSEDDNNRRDSDNIDPQTLLRRLERFRRTHGVEHPMTIDVGGNMFASDDSRRSNDEDYVALVVSSDGISRWDGVVSDPAFRAALDRVVDADPGVRARRAAEDKYIKARGG